MKSVWEGLLVRIDMREPLQYHELEGSINLGVVTAIALLFAVAANAYMGIRPLLSDIGADSLQDFIRGLESAPARLQITFMVDMFGICFPPFMAMAAGALTARIAAEISVKAQSTYQAYERDLAEWQVAYNDPLATDDGQEMLDSIMQDRLLVKQARQAKTDGADFLAKTNGR
ncbi:MAG: hypothetical protein L0154_27020 [Chloroflexi bacterium]|nr:hypothetical protein [Chloroflexota bacterium]